MQRLLCFILFTLSLPSLAVPVIFSGETVAITKSDLVTERQFYVRKNGIDQFAEVAYEVTLPVVDGDNLPAVDIHLTGLINTAWFSSNFGVSIFVSCQDTLIASDSYFGIRYDYKSYAVKPQIVKESVNIPQGCNEVTIRLEKLGTLPRMYYTNIENIDIRFYLLARF